MNRSTFIAIIKMLRFKHTPDPSQNHRYEHRVIKPDGSVLTLVVQANKSDARINVRLIIPGHKMVSNSKVRTTYQAVFNYIRNIINENNN
jgi:hypothetical protein